jgi:hypothetical protein
MLSIRRIFLAHTKHAENALVVFESYFCAGGARENNFFAHAQHA